MILLDCCHSANTATQVVSDSDNIVEVIAACSVEGKTPARGNYSFTTGLVKLLGSPKYWTTQFDTAYLYSGLINRQNFLVVLNDQVGSSERGISPLRIDLVSQRIKTRHISLHRLHIDQPKETSKSFPKHQIEGAGERLRTLEPSIPTPLLPEPTKPHSDLVYQIKNHFNPRTVPSAVSEQLHLSSRFIWTRPKSRKKKMEES